MSNPNITIKVQIEWSESAYVNAKLGKEQHNIRVVDNALATATWHLLTTHGPNYGYDKTKFVMTVIDHNDNDHEHTYTGRIDLGTETMDHTYVVEDHVIDFLEYSLSEDTPKEWRITDKHEMIEAKQWLIWMYQSKIDQSKFVRELLNI